MPNFKFTQDEYLKMIDEAINMPIEKIQGSNIDPRMALTKVLEFAGRKREPRLPRIPTA